MKRWHEDYHITYREWRKHYLSHVESNVNSVGGPSGKRVGRDPYEIDCPCDKQVGRFRKKDAWDCGNTRCYICHYNKYYSKEKQRDVKEANLKFKEGLEDLI